MRYLFFPVAANSRRLSLLETISEALLRKTFLWGCIGVIFQANSLLFYWLSKSRGPRFLSRNNADSRFLSLVSCDQKQISNMLDLKTQSLAIKIVSLKLPHTADFLDFRQKSHVATINLLCALGLRLTYTMSAIQLQQSVTLHDKLYIRTLALGIWHKKPYRQQQKKVISLILKKL